MSISLDLLHATKDLVERLRGLHFAEPVSHVYNPLEYAWATHEMYVSRFGNTTKRVLFLGMNPGPWGMVQTGVPFGEVSIVRDWMGISAKIGKPVKEHPKRLVEGFDCKKSEVSGRRLWGLFSEQYPQVEDFFRHHYVVNYCPLVWMEASSRNRTPDKIPGAEMAPVSAACDAYLAEHLRRMEPDVVIGIGGFAEACLKRVTEKAEIAVKIGRILHPSPANPSANRDWAGTVRRQLGELGVSLEA